MNNECKKKKRKITPLSVFLTAAVLAAAFLWPAGSIPAEVQAGDYNNEYNMLDDAGYADFNLQLDDPEEFDPQDLSHPLESYDPDPLSWLYVGTMNKATNDANKGTYAVYNTMPYASQKKAAIADPDHGIKDGEFQVNPISGLIAYPKPNASAEGKKAVTTGTNAVAVRRGAGRDVSIVQLSVDYDSTDKKAMKDYIRLTLLNKSRYGYQTAAAEKIFTLSSPSVFGELDTRAMQAVTAMTALDMDGDGADEVALYIADPSRPRVQIFRIRENGIEDYFTGSGVWEKNVIDLSKLNDPADPQQFNKGYGGSAVPIVGLSSADIAEGKTEDLVITVSAPRMVNGRSTGRSMKSALGIYSLSNENGLQNRFLSHLEYKDKSTGTPLSMRYVSAQTMDADGNGTKELAVGGYGANASNGGLIDYALNFITWESNSYHLLYDTPFLVKQKNLSGNTARTIFDMAGPVAFTKAKLSASSDKDYLLLENIILEFKPADGQTDTGSKDVNKALREGSFETKKEIDSNASGKWGDGNYIMQAVSGRFAQGDTSGEQIALVLLSYHTTSTHHSEVSLSISWLWMEGSSIAQYHTNPEYVKQRGAASYGTAVVLCPTENAGTTDYYQYLGKNYGWSMPTPLIATAAVPYYQELAYYSGEPGRIRFGFAETFSQDVNAQVSLKAGINMDVSMETGVKMLQEEGKIGAGGGFDAGIEKALKAGFGHSTTNEVTVEGPGSTEQVFVYARPSVVYHYKKYVPRIQVTQKMIDNYKTQTGQPPIKADGTPLKAEDVIEEGWYDYFLTKQCPGAFTMMDMNTYSGLYEKYKDQKAVKVDMKELFYDYTAGNPVTYPADTKDIKTWRTGEGATPLAQLSKQMTVVPGSQQTNSFDTSQDVTATGGISAGLEFDGNRYVKGSIQLGFIAEMEIGGQVGIKTGIAGEAGAEISFGVSGKMGATVNTPETQNSAYGFKTKMAAWGTFTKVPVAMGFTVNGALEDTPLPPFRPYVYATGRDWVMLAWDAPELNNPRSADSYLIYQDEVANALNKDAPVPAGQQHFLVTGLKSDTQYTFWFAGKKGNMEGEKASPVNARTRPNTQISLSGPSNRRGDIGDKVTFEAFINNLQPGQHAEYTWQQFTGDGFTGTWKDIDGSNSLKYTVEIKSEEQDGTKYRVRADIRQDTAHGSAGVTETIYSKTAVLIIEAPDGKEKMPVIVKLEPQYEGGGFIPEYRGEYYVNTGTKIKLAAEVTNEAGSWINSGGVKFWGVQNGSPVQIGEQQELSEGKASMDITAGDAKTYTFAASFNGDEIFRADVSPRIVIHAGRENSDYYSIDYELNGGINAQANPSAMGMVPQPVTLEEPSKAYADFAGWYNDPGFTGANPVTVLDAATLAALDDDGDHHITLYAKWVNNKYSISYELDGGTNHPENPDFYTVYDPVTLKDPVKDGQQFAGWYADAQYKEQIQSLPRYSSGAPVADNITLYAKWETLTYTITYVLSGGTNSPDNPASYTSSDGDITLKDPAKDGAQFAGWYKSASFADTDRIEVIPGGSTGNLILYARWTGQKEMEPFEKDKDNVWLIHNLQELELMRDLVNSGQGTYAADRYRLCANIYGEGAEWNIPAGTEQTPFSGEFEGYDYTIDGLIMTGSPHQGIFGVIGESGTVKNLQTVNVSTDGSAENAGGIAAVNKGTIDKCGSGLNVGTSPFIHGNEITDIEAYNNKINAARYAGGIAGDNAGTIKNSHSNALVRTDASNGNAGGVAGKNTGSIVNGYNTGKIDAPNGNAGGITASNENGTLANLYNSGPVSAGAGKGAIASLGTGSNVKACYYNNSSLEPIPGQTVDAQYKKGSEMKSKEFEKLLNETANLGGYNGWEQLNVKNGGYPRILSNILEADASSSAGISVQALKVHPAAALRVNELDKDSIRYKEMQKKAEADGAAVRRVWNINYMFPDGYSSDTEHTIRLHLPADAGWNSSKIAVIHRIRAGTYETLNWQEGKDTYIAASEGLSTFAVFEYKDEEKLPDPTGPDSPDGTGGKGNEGLSYPPLKKTGNSTGTGDLADIIPWICLAGLSALAAVIIIRRGKRGRYGRKKSYKNSGDFSASS